LSSPRAGYEDMAQMLATIPCKSFRNNVAGDTDPVTAVPPDVFGIDPFVNEIARTMPPRSEA
jgi:hypothetical protein